MAKPQPKVDAVIIGVGWVGGIIASELTKAGLKVVGLERGTKRGTADFQDDHDELAYAIRYQLFQDTSKETWTLRHNLRETALPIRQLGSCPAPASAGPACTGTARRGASTRVTSRSGRARSTATARA
jgi:gluconate 2-dehydrogenase alpha chain